MRWFWYTIKYIVETCHVASITWFMRDELPKNNRVFQFFLFIIYANLSTQSEIYGVLQFLLSCDNCLLTYLQCIINFKFVFQRYDLAGGQEIKHKLNFYKFSLFNSIFSSHHLFM